MELQFQLQLQKLQFFVVSVSILLPFSFSFLIQSAFRFDGFCVGFKVLLIESKRMRYERMLQNAKQQVDDLRDLEIESKFLFKIPLKLLLF